MERITGVMKHKMLLAFAILSLPIFAANAIQGTTQQNTEQSNASKRSQAAFKALVKQTFPMSRDQIHQFKTIAAHQQEANQAPIGNAPAKGHSSIVIVSLKPDHDMPVVRIAPGRVSSLFFTDKAGKPWPIKSYVVGDPTSFHIIQNTSSSKSKKSSDSSVLVVQGQALYGQTNMAIMLEGLDVPVMINLVLSPKNFDFLDYLRIKAYPVWDQYLDKQSTSQAPAYMTGVLSGIPPQGSKQLTVKGDNTGQTKVWSYAGQYLMLTPSTLLSPAWTAKMDGTPANPSSVGMHAYQLTASPVIRLSSPNGTSQTLTVQDAS